MKKYVAVLIVIVGALVINTPAKALAGYSEPSSTFTIDKKTQIPGDTLKPGSYSIQVLDHLSDRMVVRVESVGGKEHAVFLAVQSSGMGGAVGSGAVIWKSNLNGAPALRGFAFLPGLAVEFVYPKAEAAGLAKANAERVIAIDPQSENRPPLRKMSPEDMQMINLWMLSLTSVSPNDKTPAILAQRYSDQSPKQVETASRVPSSTVVTGAGEGRFAPPTRPAQTANVQISSAGPVSQAPPRGRSVIAVLPHTASCYPIVLLIGMLALFGAAAIRLCVLRGRPSFD